MPESKEELPGEEDIFLSSYGPLGRLTQATYCGKIIARGPDERAVRRQVQEWMDREQFWPAVWFISDHGNAHPTTLD